MEGLGLRSGIGMLYFMAVARSGLLCLEGNFMYLRLFRKLVCCNGIFYVNLFCIGFECYFLLFQLGRLGNWTVWRRNIPEADEGAVREGGQAYLQRSA